MSAKVVSPPVNMIIDTQNSLIFRAQISDPTVELTRGVTPFTGWKSHNKGFLLALDTRASLADHWGVRDREPCDLSAAFRRRAQ